MLYLISLWLRVHVCLFLCISYGNLDRGPFVFERLKFIAVVRHCEFSVGGEIYSVLSFLCGLLLSELMLESVLWFIFQLRMQ